MDLTGAYLTANALTIIEAGELSPRSGLRKMFEKAKRAVALPCYVDGPGDVRALAMSTAANEDLTFDKDALDLLVSLLGEDRGVSRSEIDKLILYKGLKDQRDAPGQISLDDVKIMLVDGVGDVMNEAANAVTDGAPDLLAECVAPFRQSGSEPHRSITRSATLIFSSAYGAKLCRNRRRAS